MTILYVHGYASEGGHYPLWDSIFQQKSEGFYWESGTPFKSWLSAIFSGNASSYGYAYNILAPSAADRLYRDVVSFDEKYDVVCHSLGSRVVLDVMDTLPNCFGKVIFLNGAEGAENATRIIRKSKETKFLNVAVKTDDVLHKLGKWRAKGGCIGQAGLTLSALNFTQIYLDSPEDQDRLYKKHGWEINGDDPNSVGDHSFTFSNPANHEILKYFMDNGSL